MTQPMPSRPPSGPVVSYVIDDQVPATEAGRGGSAVRGYRVWYTTGGGVKGSVFIEQARYNANNVAAAVRQAVAVHDQVQALQS